jgi:putative MATE family efflux protein
LAKRCDGPEELSDRPDAGPDRPKGTRDMTRGRPWRHILLFSLPLLAGNFLQQLYNLVDTIVVGQGVGGDALAGVGTTAPIIFLITSLFVGVGLGATVLLSQYYGTGDFESLRKLVASVYSALLPLIVVITAVSLPLTGPILRLIQVPDGATFDMSRLYMIIIILGFLGSFGFNLNAGLLQSMGNSMLPFLLLCVSTLINVALDLLFVLVFGWGVAGAAVATVIAQTLSWLGGTVYINRHYPFLKLSLTRFEFHRKLLGKAVRLGLPSGLNQMLFSVGVLVMQGLVNLQGAQFMAGFAAANKIDLFAFLPVTSVATAITTFVAQNMGVGQIERARKGARAGLAMSVLSSAAVTAIVWPLGSFFMSLFVGASDTPETARQIVDAGLAYLRDVMPFYFLLAVLFAINAVLRGAGEMIVPMISSLAGLWLLRVPVAHWLTGNFGRDSMYYSYAVGWTVGLLISGGYYLSGRWRHRKLIDANQATMLS